MASRAALVNSRRSSRRGVGRTGRVRRMCRMAASRAISATRTESTKGGAGRSIALDTGLVERLEEHRAAQAQVKDLLGAGYDDHDLVFARADGSPLYPEGVSRNFVSEAQRQGLPHIRLHDYADVGVMPTSVAERLSAGGGAPAQVGIIRGSRGRRSVRRGAGSGLAWRAAAWSGRWPAACGSCPRGGRSWWWIPARVRARAR